MDEVVRRPNIPEKVIPPREASIEELNDYIEEVFGEEYKIKDLDEHFREQWKILGDRIKNKSDHPIYSDLLNPKIKSAEHFGDLVELLNEGKIKPLTSEAYEGLRNKFKREGELGKFHDTIGGIGTCTTGTTGDPKWVYRGSEDMERLSRVCGLVGILEGLRPGDTTGIMAAGHPYVSQPLFNMACRMNDVTPIQAEVRSINFAIKELLGWRKDLDALGGAPDVFLPMREKLSEKIAEKKSKEGIKGKVKGWAAKNIIGKDVGKYFDDLKFIMTGGSTIRGKRELIEDSFDVKAFDNLGVNELGLVAIEPYINGKRKKGLRLLPQADTVIAELVDYQKNGESDHKKYAMLDELEPGDHVKWVNFVPPIILPYKTEDVFKYKGKDEDLGYPIFEYVDREGSIVNLGWVKLSKYEANEGILGKHHGKSLLDNDNLVGEVRDYYVVIAKPNHYRNINIQALASKGSNLEKLASRVREDFLKEASEVAHNLEGKKQMNGRPISINEVNVKVYGSEEEDRFEEVYKSVLDINPGGPIGWRKRQRLIDEPEVSDDLKGRLR